MKQIGHEIWEFIIKNSALLVGLSIGMSAKIAIDSRARKLTKKEIFIKILIGFFSGYVTSAYLISHGMEDKVSWACPLATMSGESFLLFLTQNSWKIYRFIAKKWGGMKDEDFYDKDNSNGIQD